MTKVEVIWASSSTSARPILSGREIAVGRTDANIPTWNPDLDLRWDPRVSRRHARLENRCGQWFIEDVGSKHGTLVDGLEIKGRSAVPFTLGVPIQTGQTLWTLVPENWVVVRVNGVLVFGPCANIINYAWYHCRLPCIGPLQIWNPQNTPSQAFDVGLEISGYSECAVVRIPMVEPIERVTLEEPVWLPLHISRLKSQALPGQTSLRVFVGGREVPEAQRALWVVGPWDWPQEAMCLSTIAAYLCPRHSMVEAIVREAEASLNGHTFDGLLRAGRDDAERLCLQALYDGLARRQVHYIEPQLHDLPGMAVRYQTLRLPHDVIPPVGPGHGTCLDLTLVLAACLERAGLSPVVIFVGSQPDAPQHCFAGCWLGSTPGLEPVLIGADKLRPKVPADLLVVETTEATLRGNAQKGPIEFEGAMQSAQECLAKAAWACAVNIRALRPPYGSITPLDFSFDPIVEKAYAAAEELARQKHSPLLELTHLIGGILETSGEVTQWLFQQLNADPARKRSELRELLREGGFSGKPAPTRNYLDCQELARRLAWQRGSPNVGEMDLLWACLLKAKDSMPFLKACARLHLDLDRSRQLLQRRQPCPPLPDSLPFIASSIPEEA